MKIKFKKSQIPFKRLAGLLIPLSAILFSACAPSFNATAPIPLSRISRLDDSTIAKQGETKFSLVDGTRDYVKTITGAKSLASDFINLLIYHFFQSMAYSVTNVANASITANKLLNEFSGVQTTINQELQTLKDNADKNHTKAEDKVNAVQGPFDLNGGNETRYRIFKALSKLRTDFINNLTDENYLNYSGNNTIDQTTLDSPSNWGNLHFKNDTLSDPIAKIFANFQQFLFDDWYKFMQPVPVIKVTWKYAAKDLKTTNGTPILETIYNKPALEQNGIALPEAANYNFPAFDTVSDGATNTKTRFTNFISNLASLNENDGKTGAINNYTEDETKNWEVQSLTDLNSNTNTSQTSAAILYLQNLLTQTTSGMGASTSTESSSTSINELDASAVNKDNLLANFLTEKTNGTGADSSSNDGLGIKFLGSTLLKQGPEVNKDGKMNYVYDLRALKNSSSKVYWVLYKDKDGAHALTLDGASKIGSDADFYKKIFLWRGMRNRLNYVGANNIKFDLIGQLKTYLNANFDSVMLRYLTSQFSAKNTQNPTTLLNQAPQVNPSTDASGLNTIIFNGRLNNTATLLFNGVYNPFWHSDSVRNKNTELTTLITALSNLLSADFFAGKLIEIRKNLTASYANLLGTTTFKSGDKYYPNLNNGLASRLPFKIAFDDDKTPTSYVSSSSDKAWSYDSSNDGGYTDLEKLYFPSTPAAATEMGSTSSTPSTKEEQVKVLKDFFAPNQLKVEYDKYVAAADKYFKQVSFSFDFKYDAELNKSVSQVLHFAAGRTTEKSRLAFSNLDPLLMELVAQTANNNNGFGSIMKQNYYASEVVDNYFNFATREWKLTNQPSGWSYTDNFKNSFIKNYLLSYVSPDYASASVKQIYGGYKNSSSAPDTAYEALLKKIDYQNNYVDSDIGFDLLNVKNLVSFERFLTIDWLMQNNFNNFRNYLRDFIGQNNAAAFVWFNQNRTTTALNPNFGKNPLIPQNNGTTNTDFSFSQNPSNVMHSPYILNKDFAESNNFNTTNNNWEFADVKNSSSSIKAVGFKGLLNSSNIDTKTNTRIGDLLFRNFQSSLSGGKDNTGVLYNWGSLDNLIQTVKNVRTFSELNSLVSQLSREFPNISFDNVNRTTIKSPVDKSPTITLSLEQRVNALLNVVYGYNYTFRTESLKIFNESVLKIYNTAPTTANDCSNAQASDTCSLNEDGTGRIEVSAFNQFTGSLKNGITDSTAPYSIRLTDNAINSSVAYVVQINYNDVLNAQNFKAFLKKISADVFLQTLFTAASVNSVQQLAKFDFLKRTNFKKFIVYDSRVYASLGKDWATANRLSTTN